MLQNSKQIGKSNVYRIKVELCEPKRLEDAIAEFAEEGFEVKSIFLYPGIQASMAERRCHLMYLIVDRK
jgi:hypothetical protein